MDINTSSYQGIDFFSSDPDSLDSFFPCDEGLFSEPEVLLEENLVEEQLYFSGALDSDPFILDHNRLTLELFGRGEEFPFQLSIEREQ